MVRRTLFLILTLAGYGFSDTGFSTTIQVTETDNSPKCQAGQLKVSAGTLTCSGQTATITTGGGGSGGSSSLQVTRSGVEITSPTASINFYSGDFVGSSAGTTAQIYLNPSTTNYIWNTSTLQSGATFYVSSGTVAGQLTVGTLKGGASGSSTYLQFNNSGNFGSSASLSYDDSIKFLYLGAPAGCANGGGNLSICPNVLTTLYRQELCGSLGDHVVILVLLLPGRFRSPRALERLRDALRIMDT